MKILLMIALSFASQAQAYTVYKYYLNANSKVAQNCDSKTDEGNVESKINVALFPAGKVTKVFLKAKVCTVSYGYRRIDTFVNIPSDLAKPEYLKSLAVGQSQSFSGVPSATGGSSSNVTLSRLDNRGTMAAYQVKWSNGKTNPITVFVETDANKAAKLAKIAGTFPWARISYQYSHAFISGGLTLEGPLREKTQEN